MGSYDQTAPGSIDTMYSQTAKVAETFWEWRYKEMTRFFIATAGILVVLVGSTKSLI